MVEINFEGTWLLRNRSTKKVIKLKKDGKLYSGNYYREDKEGQDVEDIFWDDNGDAFEGKESFYQYYKENNDIQYNRNSEYDLMERLSSKFSKENIKV